MSEWDDGHGFSFPPNVAIVAVGGAPFLADLFPDQVYAASPSAGFSEYGVKDQLTPRQPTFILCCSCYGATSHQKKALPSTVATQGSD